MEGKQGATDDALRVGCEEAASDLMKLSDTVKLVAFACEARRVLEGIERLRDHVGVVAEHVEQYVPAFDDWKEFEDTTGRVLSGLGRQIDQVRASLDGLSTFKHCSRGFINLTGVNNEQSSKPE